MDGLALSPDEVIALVHDILLVRYATVVTLALLVYDYALTFDEEKRLVWPTRLSLPKVLFLLNRYLPFAGSVGLIYVVVLDPFRANNMCRAGFLAFASILFVNYVIAELILYVRTYAIFGCTRPMLALIVVTLSVIYGAGIHYTARFFSSVSVVNLPLQPSGCILTFSDQIEWVSFIALICSETFAVSLLVFKAFRISQSTIMRMMIRDGVAYYIFILCTSIANLIVLRVTSPALCNLLLSTQAALHSIFCSRLLLSIRGAYESLDVQMSSLRPRSAHLLDSDFMMSTVPSSYQTDD